MCDWELEKYEDSSDNDDNGGNEYDLGGGGGGGDKGESSAVTKMECFSRAVNPSL